jgi:hypothetical protein
MRGYATSFNACKQVFDFAMDDDVLSPEAAAVVLMHLNQGRSDPASASSPSTGNADISSAEAAAWILVSMSRERLDRESNSIPNAINNTNTENLGDGILSNPSSETDSGATDEDLAT